MSSTHAVILFKAPHKEECRSCDVAVSEAVILWSSKSRSVAMIGLHCTLEVIATNLCCMSYWEVCLIIATWTALILWFMAPRHILHSHSSTQMGGTTKADWKQSGFNVFTLVPQTLVVIGQHAPEPQLDCLLNKSFSTLIIFSSYKCKICRGDENVDVITNFSLIGKCKLDFLLLINYSKAMLTRQCFGCRKV